MPSDTALNLVNRVLRTTGDYPPITTLINSPSNIAAKIVDFMNLVVEDIDRKFEFNELQSSFQATANGTSSVFISANLLSKTSTGVDCLIDGIGRLTEVSPSRLAEMRATPSQFVAQPQYFARKSGLNDEIGVDIYATPANGSIITVTSFEKLNQFTLNDASTIKVNVDDMIVLGSLAHMDAYDNIERGYMQLYQKTKDDMWQKMMGNVQYRTEVEDYR